MAYRFKLGEPIGKGVRRIALEQIDRARTSLGGNGNDHSRAVHDARKCLKRARALLRLVRPSLGEREFKDQAHRLRDIALLLSGARDAHVARLTLAALETNCPIAPAGEFDTLRKALAHADGATDAAAPSADVLEQALAGLSQARDAAERIEIAGRGFDPLARGLARSFSEFHDGLDRIHSGSHDEDYHELRKHAQIHWRHLLLVRRAWPEWIAVRAALARALSDRLGEDHDLSVLRAKAAALEIDPAQRAALDAAIADRQAGLRARALIEARSLAVDRPKGLSRRLAGYWRNARQIRALSAKKQPAKPIEASQNGPVLSGDGEPPAPVQRTRSSGRGRRRTPRRRPRQTTRPTA